MPVRKKVGTESGEALIAPDERADDDGLSWAHPLVREWFLEKFGSPTEPQTMGWPHIVAGRSVLISAPTGSGKTLAAFLACIDALVRKALDLSLTNKTEVLYVSPLKALSNDVNKNLEKPLSEIMELARSKGIAMAEIRTAVRTGDTLAAERRRMLTRPPHILVTTPESLYILLTAEKSRAVLGRVSTVIVDEIHALADDKRGSHLALSLERLEALCEKSPVRIGLSATQKPIEDIARFLVGTYRPQPEIIQISSKRVLDLAVEVSDSPLGAVASNEMWDEIYDRIAQLVAENRSTLVFVNTRRLAERVAHNLASRVGEELVDTHHGSLSRKLRLTAEEKLKSGEYKVLIATASLELGIDIGNIDLVCQMGSPRSIAVALQRIGRAGHWRGAVPKGRLFATTRDELLECAAVVKAIREGELDRIIIPECPRDVLAQQIVASCATNDWHEDALFSLLKSSYPYRNLSESTYQSILEMLSEGFAGRKVKYGRYLHRDTINKQLKARRGSRMLAITNGGAIPDNSLFMVMAEPEQVVVGTVDEDFAVESSRGDIFLLGNSSWMIRRVMGNAGLIMVEDAHGAPPNVPFWRGEAPARTPELSQVVADVRQRLEEELTKRSHVEAVNFLVEECGLDKRGAEQAAEYIANGRSILGTVPTQKTIIAERFFDESGGMQLVIHAPFGGRINKAWGLALRKRFCKSFNLELQASATDDGINISLTDQHSFPLSDVFHYLHANSVTEVLRQTALQSPLFTTRWRWDANRALALLRFSGGKKVPPQIQRMRADDLLAAVFPQAAACQDNIDGPIEIPEHPLVDEVMDDVLHEALDLDGLIEVLTDIDEGRIRCVAVDTPQPSEFAHEILNANPYAYLDDAPLEERRARAVEMRRILPDKVAGEFGRLDPVAIEKVCLEALPDLRDEEELRDLLKTVVFLPSTHTWANGATTDELWRGHFSKLVATGRASVKERNGRSGWVAAETVPLFDRVYQGEPSDQAPLEGARSREDIVEQMVSGWLMHSGPITAPGLAQATALPVEDIQQALLRVEARGAVLRGHFSSHETEETEWCDRGLLARIHRLTIGAIRKLIEPVSAAQFMTWLFLWQHVSPSTQLVSEHGTLEILKQLQGFEVAASGWESQVLGRRIKNYRDSYLDNLCLTGQVGWARLSPHPALIAISNAVAAAGTTSDAKTRRVVPTSASPIAFYLREDCEWMKSDEIKIDTSALTSQARKVLEHLTDKGASFFVDLVRVTRLLKSEVEMALWELVTAGLVTADGFDNLRALTDVKRRSGQGFSGRASRSRHSHGRWSRIHTESAQDGDAHVEAVCWMLLKRYGVIFRELLTRETNMPKWREVLIMLRRLEAQGKIRGGRFVTGFLGEQFALSAAVESLRLSKNTPREDQIVKVAACDPLNLVGIVVPGDRVAANSNSVVVFRGGVFETVEDLSRSEAPLMRIAGG
ncbi:MAG: DEAD/DEAH box helicase [Candidatus Obscuribacterales bacterium]|nr:DEAD/DEAH box helicase [Candidatus Obscuribacterales bacterium]